MAKLTDIFRDRNDINEKVIVGYISFGIMVVFAILDIVTSYLGVKFEFHQFIFDAFLYLTLGAFGISSVDKYTNKTKSYSDVIPEPSVEEPPIDNTLNQTDAPDPNQLRN